MDLNGHFSKIKWPKGANALIIIRAMQIKSTVSCHFTPFAMAIIGTKQKKETGVGNHKEKRMNRNENFHNCYEKSVGLLQNIKNGSIL